MSLYNEIYNQSVKDKFLEQFPETTKHAYKYVFYRSYILEQPKNKDLYEFTADELEQVLYNSNHITAASVRNTYSILNSYLTWAAQNGYSESNISPIRMISTDNLDKYVDRSRRLYFSDEKIREIEDSLINFQDKATVRLLFQGVGGNKLSEIVNLRRSDVNWDTGELKLKDDKHGERTIVIPEIDRERTLSLMDHAYRETNYLFKNGESTGRIKEAPLVEGDFIIKNAKMARVDENAGADTHTIYRRMTNMKDYFDIPELNPKAIQRSGMLKMAKDLYEQDGKFTNEQYRKIAEQFGLRKIKVNSSEIYNYATMKSFINRESLMDVYEIDIEK